MILRKRSRSFIAVTTVWIFAGLFLQPLAPASATGGPHLVVTSCAGDQLEVALSFGPGAAGHGSDVVLIANIGQRSCKMKGFPLLRLFTAKSAVPVSITHSTYMFKNVRPITVLLNPGRMASFGIDYGDTYSSKSDVPARCLVTIAQVTFGAHTYEIPFALDVCLSDRHLGETPIQSGVYPMPFSTG